MTELIVRGIKPSPSFARREFGRWRRKTLLKCVDQRFLPGLALDLPRAEPDEALRTPRARTRSGLQGRPGCAVSARSSRCFAAMEAALLGLVMVLQRDQEPFDGTQWQHRRDQDQRPPQQRMNPVWRRVEDLHGQGRAGNNEPGKEHDEKCRPVGRIDKRKVEAASTRNVDAK